MNRDRLKDQLKSDEGIREYAYTDSEGYLTIGVGRLIDRTKGGKLSRDEIEYLLNNDIDRVVYRLGKALPWFADLSDVRQEILINMGINLGVTGLLKFQQMLAAIARGDWLDASREGLDSLWAGQVGDRSIRLMKAMRTNQWET